MHLFEPFGGSDMWNIDHWVDSYNQLYSGDWAPAVLTHEPYTGFWRRFGIGFMHR